MDNKSDNYRKMLAYLGNLGADLGPHATAKLASSEAGTLIDMDSQDLMHYQRVLEATIDNRDETLMDKEAMRDDLTEVVRERFQRGLVKDKTAEAREFRGRVGSLEHKHAANEECPICGPNPNHTMSPDRPLSETQYDLTDEEKARDKRNKPPDY